MRPAVLGLVFAAALPLRTALAQNLGRSEQAILDGSKAAPSDLRATVAVVDASSHFAFCTGTLVAPDVVITAAHCGLIIDDETNEIMGERAPETLAIAAGLTDVSNLRERDLLEVADLAVHPDFAEDPPEDPDTLFGAMHDIAVITLAEPVSDMAPVPVLGAQRARELLRTGRQLLIEGFGSDEENGHFGGGILRTARVPLVKLGEDEFIAGAVGTPDTCPGDSGGPVYLDSPSGLSLVGITSRALAGATQACGQGGIYTLAPAYLPFMRDASPSPIATLGPDEAPSAAGDGDEGLSESVSPSTGSPASVRSGCQALPGAPLNIPAAAMFLGLLAFVTRRRG